MKVLVIFGSKSDANIYEPLKSRLLADGFEVDFKMISVHRSPELLDRELSAIKADAIIAGAGLAAHLPGILASKNLTPVFGIPCAAALGGMDSLFAMLQMPFGIPALITAPDQYNAACDFVRRWSRSDLRFAPDTLNLVIERHKRSLPHISALLEKAQKIAEKRIIELNITDKPVENGVNVCLVDIIPTDPDCPLPFPPLERDSEELRIMVPVLNSDSYREAQSALLVMRRIRSVNDGLWVGVNQIGNGLLAAMQLTNFEGRHSAFLTNAKKGYIHA